MTNKKYMYIGIVILSIIILSVMFGPYIKNNIILSKFANQLYTIPLPSNTSLIYKDKAVGNLFGTGNHLDFWAVIEIESSLSEAELMKHYSMPVKSANEISGMKLDTRYPDPINSDRPRNVKIEIIPKNRAHVDYLGPTVYRKVDAVDDTIAENIFIVQLADTHYAPGWDIRAH